MSVPPREYFVYILASESRRLYIGVTSDLAARVYEHKQGTIPGFTSRYRINWLVYFDSTSDVHEAIAREKQLKGWTRAKKIELIETQNPFWDDLSHGWYAK